MASYLAWASVSIFLNSGIFALCPFSLCNLELVQFLLRSEKCLSVFVDGWRRIRGIRIRDGDWPVHQLVKGDPRGSSFSKI